MRALSQQFKYRVTFITVGLAMGLFCIACRAHAEQPLTVAQYGVKLSQAQADIDEAAHNPKTANRALSDAIAIQNCVVIENLPSDQQTLVYVDNRPLVTAIESAQASSDKIKFQEISDTVSAIRSALPKSGDLNSNIDPQSSVRSVMSRAAFASSTIPPESLWDKFWDWVYDEIKKIHFPHYGGPTLPAVSPVIPEVFLVLVLVAAITLLGYIIFQIVSGRQARQARLAHAESMLAINAEEQELVATHNYARLRQLATDAANSGNYRAAFRLVFLALLVFLDAEGAIKLNRSRTNWEYLRGLRDRDQLASQIRPLVRDFDRIWYGEQAATEADYVQAGAIYDDVQNAIVGAKIDAAAASKLTAQSSAGVR